jgi:hypothetical protein
MPSIEELLPLLEGVREERYWLENVVLKPGESTEWVAPLDGWMSFVAGMFNQKHTTVVHNIWVKEVSFSPYTLYTAGATQANSMVCWCSKYDSTNDVYVLVYAPRPYKFFRKNDYIRITAPKADPVTGAPITTPTVCSTVDIQVIYITDREKLRESLRSLGVRA